MQEDARLSSRSEEMNKDRPLATYIHEVLSSFACVYMFSSVLFSVTHRRHGRDPVVLCGHRYAR
jgi:hypothetical protein